MYVCLLKTERVFRGRDILAKLDFKIIFDNKAGTLECYRDKDGEQYRALRMHRDNKEATWIVRMSGEVIELLKEELTKTKSSVPDSASHADQADNQTCDGKDGTSSDNA